MTLIKEDKFKAKVTIIIPTLNESRNLPYLLSDLSEINNLSEILVIDSNSKDKTKDIALIFGAKFYKTNKRNRGLQLNFGAKKAKANWLLFIHADSRFRKDWSKEVKKLISKESNFIHFFKFKINNKNLMFRILEFLVNLRCFLFKNPYGDQGILISKKTFYDHDGFKEIPIMEDVDFIRRITNKKQLKPLKSAIFTSSRKWEKINFIFQSINNWKLRRRWLKGDSLKDIYSSYYKKN